MKPKTPLSSLNVTGPGVDVAQSDPLDGMTADEKSAYFLESLLYYAQLNAPTTISPHTKGVYFLLAYSPLALLGCHKFYIGKCLQGILISIFTAILGGLSFGYLLPVVALVVFIFVCIETYADYTRKKPICDAAGRPLR